MTLVTVILTRKSFNMESKNAVKLSSNLDLTKLPDILNIDELIQVLRIPHVSTAKNYHNVVKNLIRFRDLPRIQICKKILFPKHAIIEWINSQTIRN